MERPTEGTCGVAGALVKPRWPNLGATLAQLKKHRAGQDVASDSPCNSKPARLSELRKNRVSFGGVQTRTFIKVRAVVLLWGWLL